MKYSKRIFLNAAIVLTLALSAAQPVHAGEAALACASWFKKFNQANQDQVSKERALADEIKFDPRPSRSAVDTLSGIQMIASQLCSRLDTVVGLKAHNEKRSTGQNCASTFSDWEDAMDGSFTHAVMDTVGFREINRVAAAQDTHRREARSAVALCRILDL